MNYPYEYFSGANVQINVSDVSATDIKTMIECAGITFNVSESNQPVYGYASNLYDAVLPGRRIIQGSFIVNFHTGSMQLEMLNKFLTHTSFVNETGSFDIDIYYGVGGMNKTGIRLNNCFVISRGQSIQISENVIMEEFGFISRNMYSIIL
jgi:hypothetical protein